MSFGAVFFSSLCVGTFGLGSWQAVRYFDKVDLVAAQRLLLLKACPNEDKQNEETVILDKRLVTRKELEGSFR